MEKTKLSISNCRNGLVVLNLMRIGLFLALVGKALQEKTITIPIVDRFINAYMDK